MILTTIDFLVGEETNIFLPGNKIGRIHTQHPRWNSQIYPWLLLWVEKRCTLSYLKRQLSVFLTWEKAYELPADQETDIGISCSSFIAQLLNTDPDCPSLLTQFYAVYCLPLNGNIFSQASFLALVNKLMELKKYTSHHGMIQSILLFSFYL